MDFIYGDVSCLQIIALGLKPVLFMLSHEPSYLVHLKGSRAVARRDMVN